MLEARRTPVLRPRLSRVLSFLSASSIASVVVETTTPSAALAAKPLEDISDDVT